MTGASRPLNRWDIVKAVGLILMFADHLGLFFFPKDEWLRAVGRASAPIFLFLAGYAASYRFDRALLGLALLMTLSNAMMGEFTSPLNILYTILLCRFLLGEMEKRGRRIVKPWEWYIASAVFIPVSVFFVQYGTLGLLFAVAGHMKRRPQDYPRRTQALFLALTFAAYAATYGFIFGFGAINILIMLLFLYGDYRLLQRLDARPLDAARIPPLLAGVLKFSSRHSAYIYAVHLIILSWMTGIAL